MTHLIIAKNISENLAKPIENLPQFYLGSIAPDAVHNRANYTSDYKKDSHLCVGPEKWGMVTNNDEWENSIISFLNKHKNSENRDFVLGYCSHILADLCNNITKWIPFKAKYPGEWDKGYGSLYHQEANKVDIELALTYERADVFWSNLAKSCGVDLPEIVYASEIEQQKDNILNLWYKDKCRQDISLNKVVTYENEMEFIKNASEFVMLDFQKCLNG